MSYHPFTALSHSDYPFTNRSSHWHRPVPVFVTHPAYPYGRPSNPYTRPVYATRASATDLDEEERLALAQLASIQQRRERGEAASSHETALREIAQIEKEAAIRAGVERELAKCQKEFAAQQRSVALAEAQRRREQAILQAQREREIALALTRRQREVALAQAQHHHQIVIDAADRARQYEAATRQARYEEKDKRREAKRAAKLEGRNDFNGLNDLFGAMFGIDIAQIAKDEKEAIAEDKATESKRDTHPADVAQPTTQSTSSSEPVLAPNALKSSETDKNDRPAFPEDINQLLSECLGLRVEPTPSDDPGSLVATSIKDNGVPKGLNEFLSRFGLKFEPLDIEKVIAPEQNSEPVQPTTASFSTQAASTSAQAASAAPAIETPIATAAEKAENSSTLNPAAAAAAAEPTPTDSPTVSKAGRREAPITSFLSEFRDIPPFVRDILSNVEAAFVEGACERSKRNKVNGKGKGVAEGEKKVGSVPPPPPPMSEAPKPAETETSTSSLDTLKRISADLSSLKSNFIFPTRLAFSSAVSKDVSPPLLFNRINSPYHSQAHKLLQLLLQADSISSDGDKEVRKRRKQVVREVEGAIEELERQRDGLWCDVQEKREKGEIESDDEDSLSTDSSIVDSEERHPAVNVEEAHAAPEFDTVAQPGPVEESKFHDAEKFVRKMEEQQALEMHPQKAEDDRSAGLKELKASKEVLATTENLEGSKKGDQVQESQQGDMDKHGDKEEGYQLV